MVVNFTTPSTTLLGTNEKIAKPIIFALFSNGEVKKSIAFVFCRQKKSFGKKYFKFSETRGLELNLTHSKVRIEKVKKNSTLI